ncbi:MULTISPECIES: hypothetical protein [unclassified Nocardioides]|uniref:hypothetical protein n=1 Tax=unclassified Nocardioides TaxID=2615069 RepID=UPI0006F9814F|nr:MULTISPECIES: hypothetical protein [unclassified Nocardioides]KQY63799.1 hypothetical protein ASD30_02070 [Nocardioides sp. Root140]KQZ69720.1 hypothetical protein ASD66_08320 [Nocardioides sp. Root151]KRF15812.1 hypothetical protein ASH02_04060 [Nocardioides sp. Soil796]
MNDVQSELAALRDMVVNARSMPMSASAVINRQEFLDAIERLEQRFTAATSESAAVLADRDGVVAEGEGMAIEIVRQAELKRDHLVSDTEVFRLATREAETVRADAVTEAEQLRRDADAYIEQRFSNFEHSLERTLTEVRRGIANLSGRSSFEGDATNNEPPAGDVLLSGPEAG